MLILSHSHIQNYINKANSMIGTIRRTFTFVTFSHQFAAANRP